MSSLIYDDDKGIVTYYWVYLDGVSLDFDPSWTVSEVEICMETKFREWSDMEKGCRRWVGLRSLEWVPSTPCLVFGGEDILVRYGEDNNGPPHTGVIAGWEDFAALAHNVKYQNGIARLDINKTFEFATSTVRLMVRKISEYYGARLFKLSVIIEDIHRDEWNRLLEYQQELTGQFDHVVDNAPYTWRGNGHDIEQTPEFLWQNNLNDITNNVRHIALESLPLVFKRRYAQSEAIQRGVSLDDFEWKFPNHHETCVVRSPYAQRDTPLRALRLDITLMSSMHIHNLYSSTVWLSIAGIDLTLTSIMRSPSRPNTFSSSTFRLDPPYAALANATIRNHSSQIIEISPYSQSPGRIITTGGSIHVNGPLQIMGSVMGDMYTGPISGNAGGHNNTNHFTVPLTAEAVASAVLRALDLRLCDGGRVVSQPEAGRKCKRDDGEDIERPRDNFDQ